MADVSLCITNGLSQLPLVSNVWVVIYAVLDHLQRIHVGLGIAPFIPHPHQKPADKMLIKLRIRRQRVKCCKHTVPKSNGKTHSFGCILTNHSVQTSDQFTLRRRIEIQRSVSGDFEYILVQTKVNDDTT